MAGGERIPSLDIAKGVAILFVIGIHAELGSPSFVYDHAINRAVPIFLVLFGITSSLWWETHRGPARIAGWYRTRLARLLPSYWLAVLLWWVVQRVLSAHHVGLEALAWSLAGYAPWIQTSWFVTVILQLVIVLPLIRLLFVRIGTMAAVTAGFLAMTTAQLYLLPLTAWLRGLLPYDDRALGFYAFWLFVPPYLWLVVSGMWLAQGRIAFTWRWTGTAVVTVAAAGFLASWAVEPSALSRIAMAAADPARALVLIAAAAAVAPIAAVSAPLAWLGRNSWEIYVGQMAAHSLGYSAWCRMGGPSEHRVPYALVLLACSVAFATVYSNLRRRISGSEARA